MFREAKLFCAVVVSGAALFAASAPAAALTMSECSAKYKAAQAAGTLNGQGWNDFRKAACGASASVAPATAPATTVAQAQTQAAPAAKQAPAKQAAAPVASGPVKFPRAVDPKYAKETAGKARMHTCVDQFKANKAANANGGLRWIQKGGGYYSECNKRLKGAV